MISNQALAVAQKYLAGVQPNDMLQKLPPALEAMGGVPNSLGQLIAAHRMLTAQKENAERQRITAMAQQGGGQPGQQNPAQPTTVADDLKSQIQAALHPQSQGQPQEPPQQVAQMGSNINRGIGGLPAGAMDNEDAFAGGGIVAFAKGDPVKSKPPTYSLTDDQKAYLAETDKIVGLPPGTSYRQIEVESAFNPRAVSEARAMGLAQIIPDTLPGASRLVGRKIDPFNPTDALEAHRALMKENMGRFKDPVKALRAYNGGWTESTWNDTKENREYAPKILGFLTGTSNANASQNTRVTEPAAPPKTGIASRILSTVTGTSDANAAEVPGTKAAEPSAPAKTNTANILGENSDAIIGGVGTGAVAANAAVNAANTRLAATHAAQNPLPPRPVTTPVPGRMGPVQPGMSPLTGIHTLPPATPTAPPTVGGIVAKNTPDWLKPKATPLGGTTILGKAGSALGRYFAPVGAVASAATTNQEDINAYFGRPNDPENGPISDAAHRVLYGAAQLPNIATFGLSDYLLGKSGLGNKGKFDDAGNRRPPVDPAAAPTTKPVDAAPGAVKPSVDDVSQADRGKGSFDRNPDGTKYEPKVDAYDEIRNLIKKLPPAESEEDAEERYQKTAEKFGVDADAIKKHFADQADSLTKQAGQARQDRDVNLWMSAAQGFFAMAGGMSPYAMKNFADGLGVGTKQMTQTLGEYNKEQREIDKANRELAKLNVSTRMQMSKEYIDRREKARDKATTHQEKQITLLSNLFNIAAGDRRTDVLAGGRDADRLLKEQATRNRAVADLQKSDEYKNIITAIERLLSKKDRIPADTSTLARLQLQKKQLMDAALGSSYSQSGGASGRPDPSKIGQFDR